MRNVHATSVKTLKKKKRLGTEKYSGTLNKWNIMI